MPPAVARAPRPSTHWVALIFWTCLALGCSKIPAGRAAVSAVEFEGTSQIDEDELEQRLATRASPKFLALFPGFVYDYEIYDRFLLERDLKRVERFCRARGFYEARARATRVERHGDRKVRITIAIDEGRPVRIGTLYLRGVENLPREHRKPAVKAMRSIVAIDDPFDEDKFVEAEKAVRKKMTDFGYARVAIKRDARVDMIGHKAALTIDVIPGDRATVGTVTIEGLGSLSEPPVRTALQLKEGEPYSTAALALAQQAVLDLGVFSSVDVEPVLDAPEGENHSIPIRVKLEPSKLKSVELGVGGEFDVIRTDVHLVAGWHHRNFFGGMRSFDVKVRPGIVLYPLRINQLKGPIHPLPEGEIKTKFRQPGLFHSRFNGLVELEVAAYPVLLAQNSNQNTSDANVIGYMELRQSIGVERSVGKFYANFAYNVQTAIPFVYRGNDDNVLTDVVVTYPSLLGRFDLRDDQIHPRKGIFLQAEIQVGSPPGKTTDVRIQPEMRGYIPLGKRVVLAMRGTVGFLFPANYDQSLSGAVPSDRDLQLNYFRAFFSGGITSNRGYPFRGVGPTGFVPFYYSQQQTSKSGVDCVMNPTDPSCQLPIGGLSLWEANAEARFQIIGPVGGVVFCDASDVSLKSLQIRILHPHLSCGLGGRVDTPVGPIRIDLGYRIPGLQGPSGDPQVVNRPLELIKNVPMTLAFAIGEAF